MENNIDVMYMYIFVVVIYYGVFFFFSEGSVLVIIDNFWNDGGVNFLIFIWDCICYKMIKG